MGEARQDALRVGFDNAIKLEFHGARVSSDAGLFPFRDLDQAAQLTESSAVGLYDRGRPCNGPLDTSVAKKPAGQPDRRSCP
jgi:hypothetical protein